MTFSHFTLLAFLLVLSYVYFYINYIPCYYFSFNSQITI